MTRVLRAALFAVAIGCGSDDVIDLLARGPSDGGVDVAVEAAPTEDASSADGASDTSAPCDGGACPCGLTDCGGVCVDLQNDPNHCGDCATSLLHFQACRGGQRECLPGFTFCNGACRDFSSDPDHCGACDGAACAAGQKCESGVCGAGAVCSNGSLSSCPSSGNRVACVDLARGVPYCGSCTTVCGPDQVCVDGTCRGYSPATPCSSCPCESDCARVQGTPAICCPGIAGSTQPICVHNASCP
jgi:hypothetical protein